MQFKLDGHGGDETPLTLVDYIMWSVEVPARTVTLLEATLSESQGNHTEGLVESLEVKEGIPKGPLVDPALVTAVCEQRIIMQMMNIRSTPAKMHCDVKFRVFTHEIPSM